jgi:sugar phosphate isomerase/epimerase
MRVGVDSYSYHRLYGEIRAGEARPSTAPWALEPAPVLAHVTGLGVDEVYLETCYLPEPESIDAAMLAPAGSVAVRFSWGHPWPDGALHGLDGGRSPDAEVALGRWIAAAARLGQPVMRITLGSPASRGDEPANVLVERLVAPVARAADAAAGVGITLAIENHGDLRAGELRGLIERVGRPNVGVTLDNVNLIRLGDEMIEGTRILAPLTRMVQLKDHLPGDPTAWGGPVCTALGEGVADLDAVLGVLADAGFDGAVCVELASLGGEQVDELAMIERSVAWLRRSLPR